MDRRSWAPAAPRGEDQLPWYSLSIDRPDATRILEVPMNTHLQVALSGAIPALIALWLVDRLDAKRPEPRSTRWLVVLVGMLSVVPALVLELVLSAVSAGQIEPQMTY